MRMDCVVMAGVVLAWADVALLAQTPRPFAFQTVAHTGRAAPGTVGTTYGVLPDPPTISANGAVGFFAWPLAGPDVGPTNNWAAFAGPPGGVRLLGRRGSHAPGTPAGVNFANLGVPRINAAGNVVLQALLAGPGVDFDNGGGIWSGPPDDLRLVARMGEAVPGAAGVRYGGFSADAWTDAGKVYITSFLAGTGVTTRNDSALLAGPPGNIQLVAREGEQAPGTPAGVAYGELALTGTNVAGEVVFANSLEGSVNSSNNAAIFMGPPGALQLLVRKGQQAPGMAAGEVFSDLRQPMLNDRGEVAFHGRGSSGDTALWMGTPGALQLVVRGRDRAPGTPDGVTFHFNKVYRAILGDGGTVAFVAGLDGPGTVDSDIGIWAGTPGDIHLIVRSGTLAPGEAPGVLIDPLSEPGVNAAGQLAFRVMYRGPGVNEGNDVGIFLAEPGGDLTLVVREGDTIDIGSGDLRTVNDLHFDGAVGFNDAGQIAFRAYFTDGTSGIFTTVPEPGAAGTMGLIACAALGRRGAGRRSCAC